MRDEELKAFGIDLQNAKDVLDTPKKIEEFHRKLKEDCKKAFEEFDQARQKANELSVSRFLGRME